MRKHLISNQFRFPQKHFRRHNSRGLRCAHPRLQALDFQSSALLPSEAAAVYLHKLCQSEPTFLCQSVLTIASAEFSAKYACNYGKYCINLVKLNHNIGVYEHSALHIISIATIYGEQKLKPKGK